MRALALTDRSAQPAVIDVAPADPGPNQVRVRVEAASVNGMDAVVAGGYVWDMMPHTFPVVLGRDFAGIVDAVGADVLAPAVGDRVLGVITSLELGSSGAISESVVADAASLVAVPEGVSSAQAAAVGLAGVTAVALIDTLALGDDDVVLVAGASGGVGAFAVQLAAASGARVIGTARAGDSADFVRGLGAADTVDHTGDVAAAVHAVAPDGLTAVVHLAGDPATLGSLLRPGGRLVSARGASAEQVGRDDVSATPVMAAPTAQTLTRLLGAVADGTLRAPVHRTYDLADAKTAVEEFAAPKLGKLVVLTP